MRRFGTEKFLRVAGAPTEKQRECHRIIKRANGIVKKSVLSILPNFIAFIPRSFQEKVAGKYHARQ
jgi:hypothetical protein